MAMRGVAKIRGTLHWAEAWRKQVRETLQEMQGRIEQVRQDLDDYVKQVPVEAHAEMREGLGELRQSAMGLALLARARAPAAGAARKESRFGDGAEKPLPGDTPLFCFHEDCKVGGTPVPDPQPLLAAPKWPEEWRPPRRWAPEEVRVPEQGLDLWRGAAPPPEGADPECHVKAESEKAPLYLQVVAEGAHPAAADWLRLRHEGSDWWAKKGDIGSNAFTAALVRTAQKGLVVLSAAPSAPLETSAFATAAPPGQQQKQQQTEEAQNDAGTGTSPMTMLDWLFNLPALWSAAELGQSFGAKSLPMERHAQFRADGGGRFHAGDIVCVQGRHLPRTRRARVCCASVGALEVLERVRAAVEPDFEPKRWSKYRSWANNGQQRQEEAGKEGGKEEGKTPRAMRTAEAGQAKRGGPVLPAVPAARLAVLSAHDALEGILASFLYTYNLQCPNDTDKFRTLDMCGKEPGWKLNGSCVQSVARGSPAAQAGALAHDVIMLVDGAEVTADTDLNQCMKKVNVVTARSRPRPTQIYSIANFAMREVSALSPEALHRGDGQLLVRALSVLKPFVWRLDRFISTMRSTWRSPVLYRSLAGVRAGDRYVVDQRVVFAAFTSLSADPEKAWEYLGEGSGTWLSVRVTAAFDIGWASLFASEQEYLLGTNTKFEVVDKPVDAVKAALLTPYDAVGLSQTCSSESDESRLSADQVMRQRLSALRPQRRIFRPFMEIYVEPQVRRESDGKQMSLREAYTDFVRAAESRCCVVLGALGEGKRSALICLYAHHLEEEASWFDPGTVAFPLFVSVPLVEKEDGWLIRQVLTQAQGGCAAPRGGVSWERELGRTRLAIFADSADESPFEPADLLECSLAERSGLLAGRSTTTGEAYSRMAELPVRSKIVLSARTDNLARHGLRAEHIGGPGCVVLRILPFADPQREQFCEQLAKRAAKLAPDLLRPARGPDETLLEALANDSAADRAARLRDLPGCLPADPLLLDLQQAVVLGHSDEQKRLQEKYTDVKHLTLERLKSLHPRATGNTLLVTMAAEVAQELCKGADESAVIEAALRRRMRRGIKHIDPTVWTAIVPDSEDEQEAARVEEERVAALMRVAEAVAAALTIKKAWSDQLGHAAHEAALLLLDLSQKGGEPVSQANVFDLFPGLPLHTSCVKEKTSQFSLPHVQVHGWLAAQWAVRAVRAHPEQVKRVTKNLKRWAGAVRVAAEVAQKTAQAELEDARKEAAERGECVETYRRALQAQVEAVALWGDQHAAAAELGKLAAECEQRFGARDPLTADASYRHGKCLAGIGRCEEAVGPLRRAWEEGERRAGKDNMLAAGRYLAFALIRAGELEEGEKLLDTVSEAYKGTETYGALRCLGTRATLHRARKEYDRSEQLRKEQISGLEQALGLNHPDTLSAVTRLGHLMLELQRWPEALTLFRRAYEGYSLALQQGHSHTLEVAREYALALYRNGDEESKSAADRILRAEGLWEDRQAQLAEAREQQRAKFRECGERPAEYAEWLQDHGHREGSKRELPELVDELNVQLRRIQDGADPFSAAPAAQPPPPGPS
eukprot:TRINITY_DN9809_c0_g1_i1.p1 TRINITY_DN9809_c0_g1~~TRINITY_DN9809_c0_g1_i1.p1  ORF type:complete len:1624 (+),score=475.15 TRINITY_DN9809_c0_g1_i1:208-4872(+)